MGCLISKKHVKNILYIYFLFLLIVFFLKIKPLILHEKVTMSLWSYKQIKRKNSILIVSQ